MSKAGKRLLSAVAEIVDHLRNDGEWDTYTTNNGVVVMRPRQTIQSIRGDRPIPPAPRVKKQRPN